MKAQKRITRRPVWIWGLVVGLFLCWGGGQTFAQAPDLIEQSVGNPPASVVAGTNFKITDTVRNQGPVKSLVSVTQYYLSTSTAKDGSAILLTGKRNVKGLKPGAQSSGKTKVTVPSGTAPGTYYFLACADDTGKVTESDETNNCLAAASQLTVPAYSQADLVGIWTINSLASGPGAPWYSRGVFTMKSNGKGTVVLVMSDGDKDNFPLNMTISSDGLVIIPGNDQAHCRMDSGKTFLVCTGTWDDGTGEMITISRKPSKTTLGDLAGSWGVNGVASGPSQPWWERGTLTFNSSGVGSFSGTQSTGDPESWTKNVTITKDGGIQIEGSQAVCRLDSHKTVMTCTELWNDDSTVLMAGAKQGASYSLSDMAGIWDMNMLATGPSTTYWVRGVMTVEADGSYEISTKDNEGYTDETSGSLQISSQGLILVAENPLMECQMDSGKTVLFCTDTWDDGTTALAVMTKNPVPHTLE